MGLLDEAIREHLELKRRRGADPGEIARQEREALGPARRPSDAADGDAEATPDAEAVPAGEWEEAPEPDVDETELDEVEEEEEDDDWEAEDDDVEEPSTDALEAPAAAAPPPPPASAVPAQDPGQATSEYDVLGEDEPETRTYRAAERDDGPDDEEDVLEETPEFLQETPEHDRLWFEQRPPRDFDFDG